MKNKFFKYFNNSSNNNEIITVNFFGTSLDFEKKYFFDTYLKYINNILSFSQNNDIKVALIKQPLYIDPPLQIKIQNKSIDELWNILISKNIEFQKHSEIDSFLILSNAILNKQLDLLAINNHNFILIDPIKEFLGKDVVYEELFYDDIHLSHKGNSLIAKITCSYLQVPKKRDIFISCERGSLYADLNRKEIKIQRLNKNQISKKFKFDKNNMFIKEMKYFLNLVKKTKKTKKILPNIIEDRNVNEMAIKMKI